MAGLDVYTGPMLRKKRVPEKFEPNTYRVISQDAEADRSSRSLLTGPPSFLNDFKKRNDYNQNLIGQPTPDINRCDMEHRYNNPQPKSVGFLSSNVMSLMDPVCNVRTYPTDQEQDLWWPSRPNKEPLKIPPITKDTTQRLDFGDKSSDVKPNQRHSSNPNKIPSLGIVPVNELREPNGKQRFWKENISYEHQFNSRTDPQYPVRAKRHGAFVWDRFPDFEVNRLLNHMGYISDKAQQTGPYGSNNGSVKGSRHSSGQSSHHTRTQPETLPCNGSNSTPPFKDVNTTNAGKPVAPPSGSERKSTLATATISQACDNSTIPPVE